MPTFRRLLACAAAAAVAVVPLQPDASASPAPSAVYVVQLDPGGGSVGKAAQAISAALGGTVLDTYEHVLDGFAVRLPVASVAALRANPRVRSVSPSRTVRAADVQAPTTWGLDRIDQRAQPLNGSYAYASSAGAGTHVYVVDTGVNTDHGEFAGRVGSSINFVPSEGLLGLPGPVYPADWKSCGTHGTHVASTAVGSTLGVAKRAAVHAVRVLDCFGEGDTERILAGLDWVAQQHESPAVVNLSLGTPEGLRDPMLEAAVAGLVASNVAVVVAAGNDGGDACLTSPSAELSVIAVAATDSADSRAPFSNYGACVDLFGPGVGVIGADDLNPAGTRVLNGTSMASPHAAGALAMLWALNPALPATDIQAALVARSTPGVVLNAGTGTPNQLLYSLIDLPPGATFVKKCRRLRCRFDAAASLDDFGVASYLWRFGDRRRGAGPSPKHRYKRPGRYRVTLVVTDTAGQQTAVRVRVKVRR